MLSTEILKWAIEEFKPEGFKFDECCHRDTLSFPDGQWSFLDYTSELFQLIAYPLFLQRIIEGINSNSENILIDQSGTSVQTRIEINGGDTPDTTEFNTFRIQLDRYDRDKELDIEHLYKELTHG